MLHYGKTHPRISVAQERGRVRKTLSQAPAASLAASSARALPRSETRRERDQPYRDQRTRATRRSEVRPQRFAKRVDARRDQRRCGPGREPEAPNRALRDRYHGRQVRGLAAFVV